MEMAIKAVWDDEYTGPRYTYYSPLRPFPVYLLPTGWVAVITGPGSDPRTIVTTEPLPQQFIDQTSLEEVSKC